MKSVYVPILKAKQGEFDAISHLSERTKQQIIPLFDIHQQDEKKANSVESSLCKVASSIVKVMKGKPIFIDLSQWAPNAQTEGGEHVIPYLRNQLERRGVIVNPVVRYDFWHDPAYVDAMKSLHLEKGCNYCVRLNMDNSTIEDVKADPDYVAERLNNIVEQLEINPHDIYLLIDFGDISSSRRSIEDIAKQIISLAQNIGFSQFMLAGASLPTSINHAVREQDSEGLVPREEMKTWQALLSENPMLNITFADYGVRNPNSPDGSKYFSHTNGKIRYTIDQKYFIARGHQLYCTGNKFRQFCDLAQVITGSEHYCGKGFSWGDEQILLHSNPDSKTGNQTTWISIDTNHHIETVVMEILEFHLQLVAKEARRYKEDI
jgi:hypothetical protein